MYKYRNGLYHCKKFLGINKWISEFCTESSVGRCTLAASVVHIRRVGSTRIRWTIGNGLEIKYRLLQYYL